MSTTSEPSYSEPQGEQPPFDYMWILITFMIVLSYVVACVVILPPFFVSPSADDEKKQKKKKKKRYSTPLAVRNSHPDLLEQQAQRHGN